MSRGRRAWAISDRDGRKYPYDEMKTEWTGMKVHKSEYESKHPGLEPTHVEPDGLPLADPRPDNDVEKVLVNYKQWNLNGLRFRFLLGTVTINVT